MGAYYDDSFHQAAAEWDKQYETNDNMVVTPNQMGQNQQMDKVDMDELGGLPIAYKGIPYNPDAGYTNFFNSTDAKGQVQDRGIKGYDYDYSGFYMNNPDATVADGQHYPDTYKKPNHPTFSDESIYNGPKGAYVDSQGQPVTSAQGGHWDKDDSGADTFTPGKANLDHHSVQELQDYFKRTEPNVKLILPGS